MAEIIVDQLMNVKPARRRQLLHWLRSCAADSGAAKLNGKMVRESDIDEAVRRLRQMATSARKPKIKATPLSFRIPATPPVVRPPVTKVHDDSSSSSSSDSDSDSDSESDEDSQSEASDLSGEEEVDVEIEAVPGILKDLMMDPPPEYDDGKFVGVWKEAPRPGTDGFSAFAAKAMKAAGVASTPLQATLDTKAECPPMQPHQEAAAFLLHPKSPINRLLVDHPTGSGKTREMIEVLDSYFFDPRPKVPIFPKEPVCQNFYAELLRWPSKYRDYFCLVRPDLAARSSGLAPKLPAVAETKDFDPNGLLTQTFAGLWKSRRSHRWDLQGLEEDELRQICRQLRVVLELRGYFFMGKMRKSQREAFEKKHPGEHLPAGPLRALRYTSAGGGYTRLRKEDGLPASALLKIGFDKGGLDNNVYSNKVVIMDEVHNLVRTQTVYAEQLTRLRDLLYRAKNSVIAGFTGTPIVSEPKEGKQLLTIIKGREAMGRRAGDEGFISSFHMRPAPLFPRSFPPGVPDAVLTPNLRRQLIKTVTLAAEPLQRYELKRGKFYGDQRLKAYCNMCVYFGSFHDGKTGQRSRILENFQDCAPKLHKIATDVIGDTSKALVLIQRNTGMSAFLEHLRAQAATCNPPFGVATMDQLAAFNAPDNLRGEKFRVIVADTLTCSEGVSFFGVRRVLLADVPASPSAFVQSVGRAIRMYGHRGLSEEEQTVTTTVYVSQFPQWLRSPLAAWAYRAQPKREDPIVNEKKAKSLIRTLKKVGIRDLQALKERLDGYVKREQLRMGKKVNAEAPPATLNDPVAFLESIGLWKQAKMVRPIQQAAAQPARQNNRRSKKAPKPPKPATKAVHRHYFVKALSWLSTAGKTAEELTEVLRLGVRTADEDALRFLAQRSRIITPALMELRCKAADRAVLESLMDVKQEDGISEGESSAYEWVVESGSEDDEELPGNKLPPLVLPSGWHTRRFQRPGTSAKTGREFVDPAGRVYRNEMQVRQIVDSQRRAENLAAKWRERLAAKAAAGAVGADGTAAANKAPLQTSQPDGQTFAASTPDVPMTAVKTELTESDAISVASTGTGEASSPSRSPTSPDGSPDNRAATSGSARRPLLPLSEPAAKCARVA
eukprot:TRINITY_DN669_c0_g1_i1.p1 TRINITY_DN669_c0_g1~~TRINITY_DN669_c0_g1_i1.p1  ORF type:complete len:1118 (+),score=313.27 TRINITY_DN669_c0_g1_i1:103-3456(+)